MIKSIHKSQNIHKCTNDMMLKFCNSKSPFFFIFTIAFKPKRMAFTHEIALTTAVKWVGLGGYKMG